MSSGAGMTDGLLRNAGTGPDRLMLPAGETPKGKLVIKAFFFFDYIIFRICLANTLQFLTLLAILRNKL